MQKNQDWRCSIKKFLYLIFGEWNGLQNIILPAVIIFLFDYVSFSKWLIGTITYQRFYLPVFFYLIALQYVMFLTMKAAVQWQHLAGKHSESVKGKLGRDLLQPLFILVHRWLLGLVIVIILISVFKNIYVYLYQAELPLMSVHIFVFKISMMTSLIYSYAFLQFAVPLIQKGRDFKQVQKYFHKFLNKNWKKVLPVYLVQTLWIYFSVLMFRFAIDQLIILNNSPFLSLKSGPLQITFAQNDSITKFLINTMIFTFGFLLSNLLYSPIIFITKSGFKYFNFLVIPKINYAKQKKNRL